MISSICQHGTNYVDYRRNVCRYGIKQKWYLQSSSQNSVENGEGCFKVVVFGNDIIHPIWNGKNPDVAYLCSSVKQELGAFTLIPLDGNIGCMVNGAGLAMATMDIIQHYGASPANFLDVGGGASADQMATSLEVVLSDPAVKTVFVNIFGGITRCDLVAQGVLGALDRVEARVPIVVRLDGTNADEGREILQPHLSDRLQMQPTMIEAARTAVALAGETAK